MNLDKRTLISSVAESAEDMMLLAQCYDKLSAGERRSIPAHTAFLTGREQSLVKALVRKAALPDVCFFGGADQAERRIACYVPDYYDAAAYFAGAESPLAALRAAFSEYDHPDHRDFLGSILGLGVERNVLGDLFVGDTGCDFFVLRDIAPYILDHMVSVGRARVHVSEISFAQLQIPEPKVKTIRDTVASLRLDSLISSGFSIARGKAQGYISAGKVQVDHLPVIKSDREVAEGSIISVRGLGRVKVAALGGLSKKGRISVTLERYI